MTIDTPTPEPASAPAYAATPGPDGSAPVPTVALTPEVLQAVEQALQAGRTTVAAPTAPAVQAALAAKPKALEVTYAGERWVIKREALDDFELLDDLGAMEAGNPARFPSALRRMLGAEQAKRAVELLRNPDTGRVPVEPAVEFFLGLMEELKKGNRAAS